MAQSQSVVMQGGLGSAIKAKIAVVRITNTAGETTYTLTAASVGMSEFVCMAIDEIAAAAVRGNPAVGSGGLFTSVAFTFTTGDEITVLCVGV